MHHTLRDDSAPNFRGRHTRRSQRGGFPGLDLDGQTLAEIRRKIRGHHTKEKEGDADGTAANQ